MAERKWRGTLEEDVEAMQKEAAHHAAVLRRFPDPAKVVAGEW